MDGLILALQFFTRIPVNKEVEFNGDNAGKSLFFLPFVGLAMGLVAGIPLVLLGRQSMSIASLFTLLLLTGLTGGLHLDGLSDTFDGFLSGRSKDRVMEIMKDSTLGAFGAIALILVMLSKFVLIYNLPQGGWVAIPLALANARIVAGYVITCKKSAKKQGLGVLFREARGGGFLALAAGIYSVFLIFFNFWYLIPLVGSMVIGELVSIWAYKKIDGLTGDVYGAIIELCEVASLFLFWGVMIWI